MLRNGEGKKLKPVNLEPLEGEAGRVLCFWGAAQWCYALDTYRDTPPVHLLLYPLLIHLLYTSTSFTPALMPPFNTSSIRLLHQLNTLRPTPLYT